MTAALDAITRSDFGEPLPGDAEIAAVFELHCQWADADYLARRDAETLADWLAEQCPAHEDGGTGDVCDECAELAA
ncbi:hypothetical protein AB0F72_09415 [Actinoplanes sp. NPDC023936]|uniref:hypothetical protein n=1 Tax=Actinoplanes sp. NPDC023936 TaxID=3154910 RepID=UPI00340724AA